MKTIHDLTKRVEEAHTRHLKEVKSLEEQTRNVSANASPQVLNVTATTNNTNVSFESLVQGGSNSNNGTVVGDDMFGSMLSPSSNGNAAPKFSSSAVAQPITPVTSTSSNLNNGWTSSSAAAPYQQQVTLNNNNIWNNNTAQQKPINPINPINPISSSMNDNKPMANSGWSNYMQSQPSNTMQQQQIPSLSTPPSFQSNNSNSMMNQMNNGSGNYNVLRSIPTNTNTNTQQSMMGMGLLKPISSPSSTNSQLPNNMPHATKLTNLHAFDPLG
jgi:SCY1-like protein 2